MSRQGLTDLCMADHRRSRGRWFVLFTAWLFWPLLLNAEPGFEQQLSDAAIERTRHWVLYDGRYVRLDYPMGDVAANRGVCTDVVIRAYRQLGIDLQQLVHEDMTRAFEAYPALWGLGQPDPNIDHRRVPNLETFLERHGQSFGVSDQADRFKPGDLVTWRIDGRLPHIGVVVDQRSDDGQRPLIVHNVGLGPRMEDVLFAYRMTGHYRYQPEQP